MITKKELILLVVGSLILGFCITLKYNLNGLLFYMGTIFLVISVNLFAKKISAFYLDMEIENDLWTLKYPGISAILNPFSFFKDTVHPSHKFKNPIQAGLIIPIITTFLTLGHITWLAISTFEVKPKAYRAAKRFGLYSFSEVTENHIGLVAFWGILANLFFAFIAYLLNYPEFARLSIYYAAFSLIPLSELDGNKLFFGRFVLWSITAIITLIALAYALLLI